MPYAVRLIGSRSKGDFIRVLDLLDNVTGAAMRRSLTMQRALASIAILLMLQACVLAPDPFFFPNVHYDRIQGPTIAGGMMGCLDCDEATMIMRVEAGKGGGELSIGYGDAGLLYELAAKASVLQTWGDPIGLEPEQTYIGVGLDLMNTQFVYVTVSHYWHIAGSDDEHDRIWSVGVGFGF